MNLDNKKCIVCNASNFAPIYSDTLLKCGNCGFVTANLEIDNDILKNIYTENYFKGEEYLDYKKDKATIQLNFEKRLKYLAKKIISHKIKSVLEVGCAYGFFADVFTKQFSACSYIGLDVVEEAINFGKQQLKQNLLNHDYLEYQAENKFTDIFMWDVIEHLAEPDKFIRKMHNELENDGHLYITTGDIGALIPKIRKQKWRMIHPPSHLHYFSKQTIKQMLVANGFSIVNISYPKTFRSIKQMFYSLFMLNKKPSSFINKIYKTIPGKLQLSLNTFDIMFVIAKKKA